MQSRIADIPREREGERGHRHVTKPRTCVTTFIDRGEEGRGKRGAERERERQLTNYCILLTLSSEGFGRSIREEFFRRENQLKYEFD